MLVRKFGSYLKCSVAGAISADDDDDDDDVHHRCCIVCVHDAVDSSLSLSLSLSLSERMFCCGDPTATKF